MGVGKLGRGERKHVRIGGGKRETILAQRGNFEIKPNMLRKKRKCVVGEWKRWKKTKTDAKCETRGGGNPGRGGKHLTSDKTNPGKPKEMA